MPRIAILDTTLRDGEQSPGATMTQGEKLRVAKALEELGVDIIEAGFPAASPAESDAVKAIGQNVRKATVAALARSVPGDIEAAAAALDEALLPRIHTFIGTSPLHRERKLRLSRPAVLERISQSVARASRLVDDVEFSAEDAMRTELDFLLEVVRVALRAGARTINIPDTVGAACPSDVARVVTTLHEQIPELSEATLSVHCHDDLGLAVANSLAGVEHGARQVECTVNGIGERAGNAALEEIVMALDYLPSLRAFHTGVNTERLVATSRLVSAVTGIRPPPNKAIVGANAFAHEAGIHQDGLLKERKTYEILDPSRVGASSTQLVLGKHSGRAALRAHYEEMGFELSSEELDRAYKLFVLLAESKKEVHDEDLHALYYDGTLADAPRAFRLDRLEVRCGRKPSSADVTVTYRDDRPMQVSGSGDGPIDAAFDALGRVTPWTTRLQEFSIEATAPGKDAIGTVQLSVLVQGHAFRGRAASTDIVDASVRAFLNALDKADYTNVLEARAFERDTSWAV